MTQTPKPDLGAVLDWASVDFKPDHTGNQMVHCPLGHSNHKTPSMSVSLDKGLFNCQACGASGTSWDLIMQVSGVDFRGAVKVATAEQFAASSAGGADSRISGWAVGRRRTLSAQSGNRRRGAAWKPSWAGR